MSRETAFNPLNAPAITDFIQGDPQEGLFVPTADQRHRLGTGLRDARGRVWRYAKNGATQLEVALMAQAQAPKAELGNEVQTGYTTAAGDTTITVLVTTASGILDRELRDGYLVTQDGDGEGYMYPIKDNRWITGDTVMRIDLWEPIRVATAATSEFTLIKNIYRDVIVQPTIVTAIAVGVPNVVIPANYYGWLQTKGVCPMIVDAGDTLVVGAMGGVPGTHGTAGAIGIPAITTDVWGRVIYIGAAGETALVNLNLE